MSEEAVNLNGVEGGEKAEEGGDLADYLAPSKDEVEEGKSPAKDSEKSKDATPEAPAKTPTKSPSSQKGGDSASATPASNGKEARTPNTPAPSSDQKPKAKITEEAAEAMVDRLSQEDVKKRQEKLKQLESDLHQKESEGFKVDAKSKARTDELASRRVQQGDVVTRLSVLDVETKQKKIKEIQEELERSAGATAAAGDAADAHHRQRTTELASRRMQQGDVVTRLSVVDMEAKQRKIRELKEELQRSEDAKHEMEVDVKAKQRTDELSTKRVAQGDVVTRLSVVDAEAKRKKLKEMEAELRRAEEDKIQASRFKHGKPKSSPSPADADDFATRLEKYEEKQREKAASRLTAEEEKMRASTEYKSFMSKSSRKMLHKDGETMLERSQQLLDKKKKLLEEAEQRELEEIRQHQRTPKVSETSRRLIASSLAAAGGEGAEGAEAKTPGTKSSALRPTSAPANRTPKSSVSEQAKNSGRTPLFRAGAGGAEEGELAAKLKAANAQLALLKEQKSKDAETIKSNLHLLKQCQAELSAHTSKAPPPSSASSSSSLAPAEALRKLLEADGNLLPDKPQAMSAEEAQAAARSLLGPLLQLLVGAGMSEEEAAAFVTESIPASLAHAPPAPLPASSSPPEPDDLQLTAAQAHALLQCHLTSLRLAADKGVNLSSLQSLCAPSLAKDSQKDASARTLDAPTFLDELKRQAEEGAWLRSSAGS